MDFTKAVKMLKDGECEGIKSDNFGDGGYYYVLCKDGYLRSCDGGNIVTPPASLILTDWVAVGAKPKMETVEVVRYAVVRGCDSKITMTAVSEAEAIDRAGMDGSRVVRLAGMDTRPVPRPVERSIEIKNAAFSLDEPHPGFRQKVLCPWRDDIPVGIDGMLTFTWTETPKGE